MGELNTTWAAQVGVLVPSAISHTQVQSPQNKFLMLQPNAATIFGFVELREGFWLRKDGKYTVKKQGSQYICPLGSNIFLCAIGLDLHFSHFTLCCWTLQGCYKA